ncbi:MAG: hypothetical protein HC925_07610 [Coleofasciculaceae cyanobacterium SM2_3_26]|nr:hypothetical protein [Coleofasciculaceae cyanobacterium SM2_3_26]
MTDGLYVLANDVVYDQLVAILNSIEVNIHRDFPVCVVPYDDRLDRVREEVQKRDNVSLFEDAGAIAEWEAFATDIWKAHPTAMQHWQEKGITGSTAWACTVAFVASTDLSIASFIWMQIFW